MSKQYITTSWSQLAAGIAMLGSTILAFLIYLAAAVGIGNAFGLVLIALFVSTWIVIGVVLVVRGLNKM